MVLMPSAAIVLGGTLVFSCGIFESLGEPLIRKMDEDEVSQDVSRREVSAAPASNPLLRDRHLAAQLSLVRISPIILNLFALLGVVLTNLLNGPAISTRMLGVLRTYEHALA